MNKMQVVVTFDHDGRKITATRFAVGGMIANPLPDADAKRAELRRIQESLKRRLEVNEAEIEYLDKQEHHNDREKCRLEAATTDSYFVSRELGKIDLDLQTYAVFVPLSRFSTGTASWKAITPKPAVQSRRPAA